MKSPSGSQVAVWISAIVLTVFVLFAPRQGLAQDVRFDINHFNPPVDNYGLLTVETSKIYQQYHFGAGMYFHFVNDPLEVNRGSADGQRHAWDLVGPRLKLDLTFAVAFCKYYELGLNLPFILYQDGNAFSVGSSAPSHAAVGDIRLHNKFVALKRDEWPVGLAVVNTLFFPSGDENSYAGNKKVGAEFKVVLDGEVGPVLIAGNLGYRIRDEVTVFEITQTDGTPIFTQEIDDELMFGIGAQYFTPLEGLSVLTEVRGVTLAESPFDQRFNNSWFWDVGLRYLGPLGFSFSGALEVGLVPGYGVGPVGFFANIGWSYDKADKDKDGREDEEDKCPEQPEDEDSYLDEDGCPDPDNDEDAILDVDDQCPNLPEDVDDYRDEDGCPDLDNDLDGIADSEDKCPLAAEDLDADRDEDGCPDIDTDRDGIEELADKCPVEAEDIDNFQDEDGCPDPDNDNDGFLDDVDQCPIEVEDLDGFKDDDGCPEPDNDKDGVMDAKDQCPIQAEVINGNADDDGCPDEGKVNVIDKGDRLELLVKVEFEDNAALIKRLSYPLLNQVAQVVLAHGPFGKLIVESHTDNRGDARQKVELSLSRAKMIKAFLSNRGIKEEQIEVKGLGGAEPVATNNTIWGRKANARLVFKFAEVSKAGGKQ